MDPLTHSLFGAALARTRVAKDVAFATPILVLSSNLPDVDVGSYAWSSDAALAFRRSWTHGPLGLAVLPLLLAGLVLLWTRRAGGGHTPSARAVLALCYLGAFFHPLLDWLNTYGVRLLMPFGDRWFYGDALFIVDPWMWLLLGGGLYLAQRRGGARLVPWAILSIVALLLLWASLPSEDQWLTVVWTGVLFVVASARGWRPPASLGRAPSWALVVFSLYAFGMVVSSRLARGVVEADLLSRSSEVENVMVSPRPATPFSKDIVALTSDGYQLGRFDWLRSPRVRLIGEPLPAPFGDERFEAAWIDPCIAGFANWARFPAADFEPTPDGWQVRVSDLRYVDPHGSRDSLGFGTAVVKVESP